MTDCSQGSGAALVEMFKSFIKQLCQSLLRLQCRAAAAREQGASRTALFLLTVVPQSKYPLILCAGRMQDMCSPGVLTVGCSLEGCPAAGFYLSHRGLQRFLPLVQDSVQTQSPLPLLPWCWVAPCVPLNLNLRGITLLFTALHLFDIYYFHQEGYASFWFVCLSVSYTALHKSDCMDYHEM